MNLDDTLRENQIVNGPFEDMAQLAQALKFAMRRGRNWEPLDASNKEALEQIASRLARILSGDPNAAMHWDHIAATARLRGKALEQKTLENSVAATARQRINLFGENPPRLRAEEQADG
jgi:hypothetical protein